MTRNNSHTLGNTRSEASKEWLETEGQLYVGFEVQRRSWGQYELAYTTPKGGSESTFPSPKVGAQYLPHMRRLLWRFEAAQLAH